MKFEYYIIQGNIGNSPSDLLYYGDTSFAYATVTQVSPNVLLVETNRYDLLVEEYPDIEQNWMYETL